ncbi:Ig domain-containing protein [Paraburkholderia sp. A3RO-2L]|jgi:hypothetical protein|uniref:Ig domain-containing protein n=1 Tax=unclassified Paraburkholderia TaxID=2615204 RepID=UPI003DA82972
MKRNVILAAALALTSFSAAAAAADYYVVLPSPNHKPVTDVSVTLGSYMLPGAIAGVPYAGFDFKSVLQVAGDANFRPSYAQWSLADGSLPQGLTLTPEGTLSGTPVAAGTSTFSVRASYKGKSGEQAYQVITISIVVNLAAATPPQGLLGQAYSYDLRKLLTVTGDSGYAGSSVTWSVVSSSLPAGLYLTSDGFIGGTPTAAGTGSLVARATYRGSNGEQAYQVMVPDITVALASVALPDGLIATPYVGYNLNNALTVSNDPSFDKSGVTWSVANSSSLPAGLTLNADGTISGTPSTAGTHSFTVQAAYKTRTGQQQYSLVVADITVALKTATLSAGKAGTAYSGFDFNSVLQVTGDTVVPSAVTWSVANGTLPAGLTLNNNGTLSGTPTAVTNGSASFQVQATYKTKIAQQNYSLSVGAGVVLQADGYRTWGDGTMASSCNAYLNPTSPYTYTGNTGDGLYRISVGGATYNTRCDMSTDGVVGRCWATRLQTAFFRPTRLQTSVRPMAA